MEIVVNNNIVKRFSRDLILFEIFVDNSECRITNPTLSGRRQRSYIIEVNNTVMWTAGDKVALAV